MTDRTSGSHGDCYKHFYILGYSNSESGECQLTCQTNMLTPFSGFISNIRFDVRFMLVSSLDYISTLKMEATYSFQPSDDFQQTTQVYYYYSYNYYYYYFSNLYLSLRNIV
jgi:hypothetical protein